MNLHRLLPLLLSLAPGVLSCGPASPSGAVSCEGLPASGLYATYQAPAGARFAVSITDAGAMAEARRVWAGQSSATTPSGLLRCAKVAWNCPWGFYLEPDSVRLSAFTIELCDGEPSYVDAHCADFGGGRYCPWSARMVALRDCQTDPTCPPVPRY